MFLCTIATSFGTPLSLEYKTTSTGAGLYEYAFTLTLDNHDGSFIEGQDFDWIIFGDALFSGPSPLADFAMTSVVPAPFTELKFSSGAGSTGHNGPTFFNASLPLGWVPTYIGDQLSWTGTSAVDLAQLRFSNHDGSGARADFELAQKILSPQPNKVPEFADTLGMLLLSLTSIAVLRSALLADVSRPLNDCGN
jgi:hypothetical protein